MAAIPNHDVDVDLDVRLRLVVADADAVPLLVSLRYSARDPYAVRAIFRGDGTDVEWVFARELIAAGMDRPTGDGDVHVWPAWSGADDTVLISLSSPDGQAVLEADAVDLRRFLARSASVVPIGAESDYIDVDGALARLLTG